MNSNKKITIGISACLLGEPVRYDGGHQLDHALVQVLLPRATLITICPEVECGFGVPRPTRRLEGDPHAPRMVTVEEGVDDTERFMAWGNKRLVELAHVDGYILKARSPSCGLKVAVHQRNGEVVSWVGRGLFAMLVQNQSPSHGGQSIPLLAESEALQKGDALETFLKQLAGG
ncbi:MAG: DUF523 domain-containing protein [Magnetococcales bacterium]|nr:DUF523 domain-containing protein [Magnetococcales bacterium]